MLTPLSTIAWSYVRGTSKVLFVASALVLLLSACGGGGGGSGSTASTPDITPNTFTFSPQSELVPGVTAVSEQVIISGIDTATTISIDNGEYAIVDGDFVLDNATFTSDAGTINVGQTLVVRVVASSGFGESVTATVNVGGVTADFVATTAMRDITLENFEFTNATDVEFGQEQTASYTVGTIDGALDFVFSGDGEFKINEGDYQTSATDLTVKNGDVITLKITSGDTINITKTATVTIGEQEKTYTVTTRGDNQAPEVAVYFPTANTLTDGNSVTLRGSASDDYGPITLTVEVVDESGAVETVTKTISHDGSDTEIGSWSYSVTLNPNTVNTLTVMATDTGDNVSEQVLTVTQNTAVNNFPADNTVAWGAPDGQHQMDIDWANNRLLIPGTKAEYSALMAIDLASGERSELLAASAIPDVTRLGIAVDGDKNVAYVGGDTTVEEVDLSTLAVRNVVGAWLLDATTPFPVDNILSIGISFDNSIYVGFVSYSESLGGVFHSAFPLDLELEEYAAIGPSYALYNAYNFPVDQENYRTLKMNTISQDDLTIEASWTKMSDDGQKLGELFSSAEGAFSELGYLSVDFENQLVYMLDPAADNLKKINVNLETQLDSGVADAVTITGPSVPELGANTINDAMAFVPNLTDNLGYLVDVNTAAVGGAASVVSLLLVDLVTGERVVLSRYVQSAE